MKTSQDRRHAGVFAALCALATCGSIGPAWAAGELVWTRVALEGEVNLYSPARVAVDSAGNVVVATTNLMTLNGGWNYGDYVTIKYDAAGNELWSRTYDGPTGDRDRVNAVAVDGAGNVYVTGQSWDVATWDSDIATIKYDPSGNVLWVEKYRYFSNGENAGNAIAVDANGNVYVAGEADTYRFTSCASEYQSGDFVTIKYGPQGGAPLWVRTYDGPGAHVIHPTRLSNGCLPCPAAPPYPELLPGDDGAVALVLDAAGNVYVTGSSDGIPYAGCTGRDYVDENDCDGTLVPQDCKGLSDYVTIKYASGGQQQWVARFDGPAHHIDSSKGVATDAAGNVFVTGTSRSSTTLDDYVTVKYNSSGAQQWVRTYTGNGGNGSDFARGIAVDGLGRVTVTGSVLATKQTGCISPDTARDVATIQYDGNGNVRWVKQESATGKCTGDDGKVVATDAANNVIVAGKLGGGSFSQTGDYGTIKYNSSGSRLWMKTYAYGMATGVAIGPAGHVHVAGPPLQPASSLRVLKYNP